MALAAARRLTGHGHEVEFEEAWKGRDSRLKDVPGFVEFHLLKGPEHEDYRIYSSHTLWATREDFEAWTESDAFREAHRSAGGNRHMYLNGPHFEGFDVVRNAG